MRVALASVLIGLVFVLHGQALPHYYAQDDVQALVYAAHWPTLYGTIADSLQYRPNAYLITAALDAAFPREPYVMRLFGIAMIILLAWMTRLFVRRMTGDGGLAWGAAFLMAAAPAFYAFPNLYLTASMTALGLLLIVVTLIQAQRFARHRGWRQGLILCALFLVGLTSYEAYVIVLPLAMLVDAQMRTGSFVLRGLATVKTYAPMIVLTAVYMMLRGQGIAAGMDEAAAKLYALHWGGHIPANMLFQLRNALGLLHTDVPDAAVLATVGAVIALAWRSGFHRLWLVCVVWMMGALAFFSAGVGNGEYLHYGSYVGLPLGVLMVLAIRGVTKNRWALTGVVTLVVAAQGLAIEHQYARQELWGSGETTRVVAQSFRALPQAARDRDALVVLNAHDAIAWRLHNGMLFSALRHGKPYDVFLPQASSVKRRPLPDKVTVLYAEQLMADDHVFQYLALSDVTALVDHKAIWTSAQARTIRTDMATRFIWRPVPGQHPAQTVRFHVRAPADAGPLYLEAHIGQNRCLLRYETGTVPVYSLILPARTWARDDRVELAAYGLPPGQNVVLERVETKTGLWMPENGQVQQCLTPLFGASG